MGCCYRSGTGPASGTLPPRSTRFPGCLDRSRFAACPMAAHSPCPLRPVVRPHRTTHRAGDFFCAGPTNRPPMAFDRSMSFPTVSVLSHRPPFLPPRMAIYIRRGAGAVPACRRSAHQAPGKARVVMNPSGGFDVIRLWTRSNAPVCGHLRTAVCGSRPAVGLMRKSIVLSSTT